MSSCAPGFRVHDGLAATPRMTGDRAAALDALLGALVLADADVAADPDAAMAAVGASMSGAMPPEALATMWQDVDFGVELDQDLDDLLMAEANWILAQGVVRGEPRAQDRLRAHVSPDALARSGPERVSLSE